MTTLNDFNYTDNVDDVLAIYLNKLLAASLRSEYRNVQTITATRELDDADCPTQLITASGANRTVELAPAATTNHLFFVINAGVSNNVLVKDSTGVTTYATLEPGEWCLALSSGGAWFVIDSNAFSSAPFSDATAIIKGSSDATKLLRFEVDGFTTGTTRVLTPPNYDGTIATLAGTETFTNKRITKRVVAVSPSATPAINVDNGDTFTITSQNAAITSMTSSLTGTPTSGQYMEIEILDDGTPRGITWGASFASGPATLPTTTVTSKWLYVGFEYSASRSKWICKATGSEQ